jgi:hypothetical protein
VNQTWSMALKDGPEDKPTRNVLNRGLPVTDKVDNAWQKLRHPLQSGVRESQFIVIAPHGAGCMMGARIA